MKIIKYTGGIGNQIFQYAFAYILEKKGFEVKADTSLYDKPHFRAGVDMSHGYFAVSDVFGLQVKEASKKEINRLGTSANTFIERIQKKFFKKASHIVEYDSKFNPDNLTDIRDLYLDGYFQNPFYWKGYEKDIKNLFVFKLPLNEKSKQLEKILEESKNKTCSIHIRRGDYLNHPTLFVCDKKYFENAISKMIELCPQIEKFVIFSDDIEWCKSNLDTHGKENIFVDWNRDKDSWQDIALMTKCSNNIIPNSSFSFWGAYLNQNQDAKIICPEIWSKNGAKNMIVQGWFTVSVN